MNEQAIQDAYILFKSKGYTKSIDDFKTLISTNPNALNDSYVLFKSKGYNKSINDFSTLMGLGLDVNSKKNENTELPSSGGSLEPSEETELPNVEQDYFTGIFGDVLRGFDEISPIGAGDIIDDLTRSAVTGFNRAGANESSRKLLLEGSGTSLEDIQKFIDATKKSEVLGSSDEYNAYNKIYEEEGKGIWGVVKGLSLNPTVIPEVLIGSVVTMISDEEARYATEAAIATGMGIGAATGLVAGGVGALPGAAIGGTAAIPYALGIASSVVEFGATFAELLTEELGDEDFTKENVKKILDNPEKLQSLRNKAIARGLIIGAIDTFTGKLAGSVGSSIAKKGVKNAVVKATAAGTLIEGGGGSLGEATARMAIGQEMDISEIALEGVGEFAGGVKGTIGAYINRPSSKGVGEFAETVKGTIDAYINKPSYKINGANVDQVEIENLLSTMTFDQLSKVNIEIKNDPKLEATLNDKIISGSIKKQVKEASTDLNEKSLDAITKLEKDLRSIEGNTTQTGKDKAAAIRKQIKDIQENQLQEEAVAETQEIELSEGETIIDSKKDKKGREVTYIKSTSEKDGVKTTKFNFNRSDKPSTQRNTTKVSEELAFGEDYEVLAEEIPEGSTVSSVFEVRESETGAVATVEFITDEEKFFTGEVVLSKKTTPNQPTEIGGLKVIERAEDAPNGDAVYKVEGDKFLTLDGKELAVGVIANENLVEEEAVVEEQEQYVPITSKETYTPKFTKDEASDYEEDYKEGDNGREYSYISSITVAIENEDGNIIGYVQKIKDEDGQVSYEGLDQNNNPLSKKESGFPTLKEARESVVDKHNKVSKKEFDKEARAKSKKEAKVKAKEAKATPKPKISVIADKDIKVGAFSRDNAIDYKEGKKPSESGIPVPYLKSVTIEAVTNDGSVVGQITKITDVDDNLSFTANDSNGTPVGKGKKYKTLGELRTALAEANNKITTKEEVSLNKRVNIAPFFNTKVETVKQAKQLRQSPEYKSYKETLIQLARQVGIPNVIINDVIGGYKNQAGDEIIEISNEIVFEDATLDQAEEYAAIIAALTPEVQEASIASQYVTEGDATHNANEYRFKVSNTNNAIKALKGAGITDFSINENESTVTFTDVLDFTDAQLQDKIGKFVELLDENNTNYEQQQFRPTESRYVDEGKRKEIIRRVKSDGSRSQSRGQGFSEAIEQAIQRDAAFQKITYEEYIEVSSKTQELIKKDNLKDTLDFFDEIDKSISKTLRSNANEFLLAIPLSTVQLLVKAIKALVKGGMKLRDAIRKVAADNNLTESQVSNVLDVAVKESLYSDLSVKDTYEKYHVAPQSGHTKIDVKGSEPIKKGQTFGTVTYFNEKEGNVVTDSFSINDIDKLSNRSSGFITTARNIAQGFISIKPSPKDITEQLFGKDKSYKNLSDANKTKVDKERTKQITQFKLPWSNNKALANINAYIKKNKDNKPSNYYDVVKQKSKDIINSFKEEVKNNLRALYNNVSEEFKERSRQWYNGANRLAQNLSKSYGVSLEQSAGILAALSPKNNWFNNISAAERVMRAWADHQDTTVTQEMVDRTIEYMERNGEAPFAKNIKTAFAKTKGRSISELTKEYKKTGDPKMLEAIGIMLRIIDQSEYSPVVYSVSPEGFIDGKYGVIGWSGGAALSNAVSMLIDPSMKNISSRLGKGNKVRNFYGNIIDPQNAEFLTADTHAFAAGLMLPASANQAQGFGLFKGGMSMEYAIFKDAYIELAKEFGILPRELQSITWEAVRGSINTDNRTPSMVKDINKMSEELLTNGESNQNRTNEILKKYPIKFSKGEWSNRRGIVAQATVLGVDESLRQTADTGRGTTVFGNLRGRDTQVGGGVTGEIGFDEVADLDVKSKDNLAVVSDFLDGIDRSISKTLRSNANEFLLAIPLGTIQLLVKGLKALVKGGMKLRDAIKKMSSEMSISQDLIKDILNTLPIRDDFKSLMDKVDALIARQKKKGVTEKKIISNVDTLIRNSDVYKNADDAQKKVMEREGRTKMEAPARRAPSIGRILGALKDITNVSKKEKLSIISRIRELTKDATKDLVKEIRDLASLGTITANQAANIISRFGKVNMLNERSVSSFVDYMAKIFNDAKYTSKLKEAKSVKKSISKLSKNKDKNADLRNLAKKFNEIDPSSVEDIDAYIEMASKIKESIEGSKVVGDKLSLAEMININEASKYINETVTAQNEKYQAEKIKEIEGLMGIDASDLSYEDMILLLDESKEENSIKKKDEKIVRSVINKLFGIYSAIIKDSIKTGKDPITGEDVNFTKDQKNIINSFMDIDLNILPIKESIKAIDALSNFLQNNSTAGMGTFINGYTGLINSKKLSDKNVKAYQLKKYGSPLLGKNLGNYITTLPVLFEKLFKGFNAGLDVMSDIGLLKLIKGNSIAKSISNKINESFVKKFYDKKANGEAFNTEFNAVERGMIAFMMRNLIGTKNEMANEFQRRKDAVKTAISLLSKGNEQEQKKAKIYKKVYDKLTQETGQMSEQKNTANNIDQIKDRVDPINLKAVQFWINEWDAKFDELAAAALSFYNIKIDRDLNYTTDRYSNISSSKKITDLDQNESAYLSNNKALYNKESGVLRSVSRKTPSNMYIDLSFDQVQSSSMLNALVDINTIGAVRQIQGFFKSEYFSEIFPDSADRNVVEERIKLYLDNIRNKNIYQNDDVANSLKVLNRVAAVGVGQALGGLTQPIKQVLPMAINTLFNAGTLSFESMFNSSRNAFIDRIGYGISNRGIASQAQIDSVNKLIERAANSKGEKAIKLIEKANEFWLKYFLVNPDVFIARASWMTYYEKSLTQQGIDPKSIDYDTHEVNEKAAYYAELMVARQQNVSDADLGGKLFTDRSVGMQTFVKAVMPFASFRMNQSARVGADLGTLMNETSTKEDKQIAARSLAGFGAEVLSFRVVGIGISFYLGGLAISLMGREEDDEEKEKRLDNLIKGVRTSVLTDVLSPIPILDRPVQLVAAPLMQKIEDVSDIAFSTYSPRETSWIDNLGLFGIALARGSQLHEIVSLSATGKYTDNYGNEKTISEDKRDALKNLAIPIAVATNIGVLPSEANSVVRYMIRESKKKTVSANDRSKSEERKNEAKKVKDEKIDVLSKLRRRSSNSRLLKRAINSMLNELTTEDPEEKEKIQEKNKAERELKEELLTDTKNRIKYSSESDLKKYNLSLYNKNFGINSRWYKDHKYEKEAESMLRKELNNIKDKKYK